MKRNKLSLFSIPYVVWMAIFVVAPLILVVVYAFQSDSGFTLENFNALGEYAGVFGRSFLLAAIATVLCILIGYPMAYFLAREGLGGMQMGQS